MIISAAPLFTGLRRRAQKEFSMNALETAMRQSARDIGCEPEDFLKAANTVVISSPRPDAKVYLQKPQDFFLVKYGSCEVVAVNEKIYEPMVEYFAKKEYLNVAGLSDFGLKVSYQTIHYLPTDKQIALTCRYETKVLHPADFAGLYLPEWSNALCEKRKELDMLAVGAYDGEKLIGLAGASKDCEDMWQIGIDVLPEYRMQGIASALTSQLSEEIKKLGKLPFYTTNFGNVSSMKNAHKCGFKPAWIQIQADFV